MRKRPARSEDYFTEHPETIDKLLRWVATSQLFPSAKKYLAAFRSSWRFQIPQDTLFSSSDTPARLRALDAPQAQHEPLRRRLLREPPRRGDAGRISPPPCRVFSRAKGCLAFGRPDRPAGGTGRPRIRRDDPGGAAAGTARSFHDWKFFLLAGSGGSALLSRGAKLTLVGRPRLSQNGYCSEFPDAPTAPLVEQLAAAECTDKLVRFLRLPLLLFFLSTRFIDLLVLCVPACLLANLLPSVLCQSVLFCRFCF